jgi:hypothetical protein
MIHRDLFEVGTLLWPNTALEPTADPRRHLREGFGFAEPPFGGGSAFFVRPREFSRFFRGGDFCFFGFRCGSFAADLVGFSFAGLEAGEQELAARLFGRDFCRTFYEDSRNVA